MNKQNVTCWVEIPFEFAPPGKIYFTLEDALADKESCTHLDLGDLGLTEIPAEVFDLPNLTVLNLSNNRLSDIPREIAKLNKLILLNLDNNQFADIPTPVAVHSSILILQMRDNKISKEEFKKVQRKVKNKKVLL
jgi:Leucine-rich repeat (LRR) protein